MAISIPFSRFLPAFQPVSVIRRGFSSSGFSCSSASSIFISISDLSLGLLDPLVIGFRGFGFVKRDVIAYSHRLVAVSQSSTLPSFDIGLAIEIPSRGLCIELSP